MSAFIIAIGLLLIFEGIGPALFPKAWKDMITQLSKQPEQQLTRMGTALIITGAVIVLATVNYF